MKVRRFRSTPDQESTSADLSNQETVLNKTTGTGIERRFRKPLQIAAAVIVVAFAVLMGLNVLTRPHDKTNNTYQNFTIEEGQSLKEVAQGLEDAGIISDASHFEFMADFLVKEDLRPGTYYLSPSMNTVVIARTIGSGITTSKGFTIPAGYTIEQIASALERDGFVDREAFLKAAGSKSFREIEMIGDYIKGYRQLEGFLMPGSYMINSDADESMIIVTMLDSFINFYNDDYRARAEEMGINARQVLVLASMIENETSHDRERTAISAVLHNRINMGLIKTEDLSEVPLCSPSEESIIAALYPDENENIYYVLSSRLDGSHVFAADEEEYKKLVKEYDDALAKRTEQRESAERTDAGE